MDENTKTHADYLVEKLAGRTHWYRTVYAYGPTDNTFTYFLFESDAIASGGEYRPIRLRVYDDDFWHKETASEETYDEWCQRE